MQGTSTCRDPWDASQGAGALIARWRGRALAEPVRLGGVPVSGEVPRAEEAKREAHRAFIPSPNDALKGLGKVNPDCFVQSRSPHTQATLDMDACLVESHKKEALYSYKKYRAISRSRPTGQRPTWWCTRSFETATCLRAISSFDVLKEAHICLLGWPRSC